MADHAFEEETQNGQQRFVCRTHRVEVCGTCCLDFAAINRIRQDPEYLREDQTERRIEKIRASLQLYYVGRPRVKHRSTRGSSPLLPDLLQRVQGGRGTRAENVALCGCLSFVVWNNPSTMLGRVTHIMDFALQSIGANSASVMLHEALTQDQRAAKIAREKAEAKAKKAARKKGGKRKQSDYVDKMRAGKIDWMSPVREILILVHSCSYCQPVGGFVEEASEAIGTATSMPSDEERRATFATMIGSATRATDEIKMTSDATAIFKIQQKLLTFMLKHGAGPVPYEPTKDWTQNRTVSYLQEHGLGFRPLPPARVLSKIASQYVRLQAHLMSILNTMPLGDEAAEMGRADLEGRDATEVWRSNRTTPTVEIAAQIPSGFDPETLPRWTGRRCVPVFEAARHKYALTQENAVGVTAHLAVLDMGTRVATAYDCAQEPSAPPLLAVFTTADNEHNLAVQVLCAWRLETQPVLGLKYCYLLKSQSDPSMHMAFSRGLMKNTHFLPHDGNAEAIGILAELLTRNRHMIKQAVKQREKDWPKTWKFSVLLPEQSVAAVGSRARASSSSSNSSASAQVASGAARCPQCGGLASKRCRRCRAVYYCSVSCQKKHWKTHKKTCRKV